MTTEEFKLLMDLRSIPQRNAHFMSIHGKEKITVAVSLVEQGLVVESERHLGERYFRLNKLGRAALLEEWIARGQPKRDELDAESSEQAA